MKTISPLLLILVGLSFPILAQSKIESKQKVIVETKGGDKVTGLFISGDSKSVIIEVSGARVTFDLADLTILRFGEIATAKRLVLTERQDRTTPYFSNLFVEFDDGSRKQLAEYTSPYRGAEMSKDCRYVIFNEHGDCDGDGVVTLKDDVWGFIVAIDGSNKRQFGTLPFSFSPDGKRVAFRSKRSGTYEVWTIDVNGGSEHQLTTQARWAGHIHWSPDGRWIAFYSNDDTGSYAAVVRPDGSGFRRVSPNVGNGWGMDWTVDGKLVFPIEVEPGKRRMHSVKPDGTGLRDITGTTIRVENRLRCGWPQEDKGPLKEW
ncbi:MAG: PD40 domain-containing protein [Acidobacteriota bacterium]|nr:MAG: PD40 domain-containing protein [Acidobacteriota bacterium]